MIAVLGQLVILALRGAAALVLFKLGQLAQWRLRRMVLPMVPREKWSEQDRQLHAAGRHEVAENDGPAASPIWQMHRALERLNADAAAMAANLAAWRGLLAELDRQRETCTREAERMMAAGRRDEVSRLLLEGERYDRRAAQFRQDIARVEGMLADCQRDKIDLDERIGDELRQTAVADARLTAARDRLRARQAAHNALGEEAISRREQLEREADRIEAAVEVLSIGVTDELSEAFLRLEGNLPAEQPRAVQQFGRKRAGA